MVITGSFCTYICGGRGGAAVTASVHARRVILTHNSLCCSLAALKRRTKQHNRASDLPKTVLPLTVVHLLAGDRGPALRLVPDRAKMQQAQSMAWDALHKGASDGRRAVVVRYDNDSRELALVPVFSCTGWWYFGNTTPPSSF